VGRGGGQSTALNSCRLREITRKGNNSDEEVQTERKMTNGKEEKEEGNGAQAAAGKRSKQFKSIARQGEKKRKKTSRRGKAGATRSSPKRAAETTKN